MARITYTDQQKDAFIKTAQEIGISPAMKKMGYPGSQNTAHTWIKEAGVDITVESLKQKAVEMREFYGQKEQMLALQEMIEKIHEALEYGLPNADAINKLSSALQRTIATMELVQGRPTSRTETSENLDAELMDILNTQKEKNMSSIQGLLDEL